MSEEAAALHWTLQSLVNENNAVLRKNPMYTEADVKLARRMLNAADTSFEQDSHLIEGATWLAFTARTEARNAALKEAAKALEMLAEGQDKLMPHMSPSLAASARAEAYAYRTGATAIRARIAALETEEGE